MLRKTLHILTGTLLVTLALLAPRLALPLFILTLLFFLTLPLLPWLRRYPFLATLLTPLTLFERLAERVSRDEEPILAWGGVTLTLSLLAAFLLLSRDAFIITSIYLVLGDGVSGMLHELLQRKTLLTSMLGMLPAFILTSLVWPYAWIILPFLLASSAEWLTPQGWWDDDLSITLVLILFFTLTPFA